MFEFIKNDVLRINLERTFTHILDLVAAASAQGMAEVAKSSFRKTCIIHISSIIEALLFYHMESSLTDKNLREQVHKYTVKSLYTVSETKDIVAGEREIITKPLDKKKLNLGQLQKILIKHRLITRSLNDRVTQVRELRNHQHLSTQSGIREYTSDDLILVTESLKKVIDLIIESDYLVSKGS